MLDRLAEVIRARDAAPSFSSGGHGNVINVNHNNHDSINNNSYINNVNKNNVNNNVINNNVNNNSNNNINAANTNEVLMLSRRSGMAASWRRGSSLTSRAPI